jgi:Cu+-exporting ATPase
MGTGTDLAQESSGIILLNGDLMAIVRARKLSKFTINAIWQNLALAFLYNMLSIPLAALGFLSPLLAGLTMSLSSISVLINSLRLRKISL